MTYQVLPSCLLSNDLSHDFLTIYMKIRKSTKMTYQLLPSYHKYNIVEMAKNKSRNIQQLNINNKNKNCKT